MLGERSTTKLHLQLGYHDEKRACSKISKVLRLSAQLALGPAHSCVPEGCHHLNLKLTHLIPEHPSAGHCNHSCYTHLLTQCFCPKTSMPICH